MKRFFLTIMAAAAIMPLTGCDLLSELLEGMLDDGGEEEETVYVDKWANLVNETAYDVTVDGGRLTYGSHNYSVAGDIDFDFDPAQYTQQVTATVTFSNIPSGYTEFKAVYEGLLGKSIQGAAAMVPMAMEIYARDAETGKKCFQLLCVDDLTVDGILRNLKQKIVPSKYAPEDDNYIQRYLPAALLKGANYENAYAPVTPYVVETGASANKFQETKMAPYGTVYYVYIFADGWDSRNRGVDVFLPDGASLYKVQNCPSCYTQCKTIKGTWGGLK